MGELDGDRPPVFEHSKYKSSTWGEHLILFSNKNKFTSASSYVGCDAGIITTDFILTKNKEVEQITFSENTPEILKEHLKERILESKVYWKPKKVKGKLKDSKIAVIWYFGRNLCKGDTLKQKEVWDKFNTLLIERKEPKKAFPKYEKFDYVEEVISGPSVFRSFTKP
jgi:hypothetical protein